MKDIVLEKWIQMTRNESGFGHAILQVGIQDFEVFVFSVCKLPRTEWIRIPRAGLDRSDDLFSFFRSRTYPIILYIYMNKQF